MADDKVANDDDHEAVDKGTESANEISTLNYGSGNDIKAGQADKKVANDISKISSPGQL